jgi:hypothetical protein
LISETSAHGDIRKNVDVLESDEAQRVSAPFFPSPLILVLGRAHTMNVDATLCTSDLVEIKAEGHGG